MSRKNGKSPKVDLKLNLSSKLMRLRGGPSTRMETDDNNEENSPNKSSSSSPISPPSSCVSSEGEQKQSDSPEATPMVLAGCPQCLMYVMLAEHDPRCPKCKSTVLLDFNQANSNPSTNNNNKNRKR